MNKLLLAAVFILSAVLLISCSKESEDELWNSAQNFISVSKYEQAIEKLAKLIDVYPNGLLASQSQLLIATIYNNELQEYQSAVNEYKKFADLYTEDSMHPKAMFLIGFIYNNQLHDFENAKIAYEKFLERYPDHELVPSAQMEIQTLGMDLNELIQPEIVSEDDKNLKTEKK